MPTIDPSLKRCTLINFFEVDNRESQDALIDELVSVTREHTRFLPGFVAVAVHRGGDGRHVINYAQWDSAEDLDAMLKNPDVAAHLQAVATIARRITPVRYEVVYACEAPE